MLYLDPGSGSFLIQLLITGVAAAGIFIAASWSKVRRPFRKNKPVEPDDDEDDEQPGLETLFVGWQILSHGQSTA